MGYQQKMLDWKGQNKPKIKSMEISMMPQEPSEKHWFYTTLGIGTAGAIGLMIGHCYWIGLAVELLTLTVSYYLYLKEKESKKEYEKQREQYETELDKKKEDFVIEVISQLENWLKQGENYSNELLITYNK